jgi:hypothetical protein
MSYVAVSLFCNDGTFPEHLLLGQMAIKPDDDALEEPKNEGSALPSRRRQAIIKAARW